MKDTKKRRLTGTVTSNAMDKTVTVAVETVKQHTKYRKKFAIQKKYKAHDPENAYQVGDVVTIEEMRPLSASKRWRVVNKQV